MSKDKNMFFTHIRQRVITGALMLAPLGVTIVILKFLLSALANILAPLVKYVLGESAPGLQAFLSILLLFAMLYMVGLIFSNLAGRWLLNKVDVICSRIPLVNSIYSAAKQVTQTFGGNRTSFQRVVWVRFPSPEYHSIGFVTGEVSDKNGATLLKLFVPTAPNPTSGFLILAEPGNTIESGMDVETAIQMILSGGIVSPDRVAVTTKNLDPS